MEFDLSTYFKYKKEAAWTAPFNPQALRGINHLARDSLERVASIISYSISRRFKPDSSFLLPKTASG